MFVFVVVISIEELMAMNASALANWANLTILDLMAMNRSALANLSASYHGSRNSTSSTSATMLLHPSSVEIASPERSATAQVPAAATTSDKTTTVHPESSG